MKLGLAASDLALFGPSSLPCTTGAAASIATVGCTGGAAIAGACGTLLGERSPLRGGAFGGGDLKGGRPGPL